MDQVWWGRVPNALALATDISEHLLSEKSIVLQYSSSMPWIMYLFRQVAETIMQQNSSKKFERVIDIDDPGQYLLRKYCKAEKRAEYRPSIPYTKFFADSDDIVLHDRYFGVKVNSVNMLEKWMEFVSDYTRQRGKNRETAVFCIVWNGVEKLRPRKGISVLSFDDYISEYDRMVFSTLAASSIKEEPFIKAYLSELIADVAGNDIELAALCVENYQELLEDTYKCIERLSTEFFRSDDEPFTFQKSKDEVDHCMWQAQIKTIYPFIEEYRETFVEKHKAEIIRELPITASYGEIYMDPKDVELGTLVYMVGAGHLQLSSFEYDQLKKYRDARNRLSHLGVLTIDEMKALRE